MDDVALRNAGRLIRERVDLAVEYRGFEVVAPIVASKFQSAGMPVIAIDIRHPGATYRTVKNFLS